MGTPLKRFDEVAHGTDPGRRWHRRNFVPYCEPCAASTSGPPSAHRKTYDEVEHGTVTGARWHYRNDNEVCEPCHEAALKYNREYYSAVGKARRKRMAKANRLAAAALKRKFRKEWRALNIHFYNKLLEEEKNAGTKGESSPVD